MNTIILRRNREQFVASCVDRLGNRTWSANGQSPGIALCKLFEDHPNLFPFAIDLIELPGMKVLRIEGLPGRYAGAGSTWGDALLSLLLRHGAALGVFLRIQNAQQAKHT